MHLTMSKSMYKQASAPSPRVTIQEVARRARVSPSTVSNLLNGRDDRMRASTRRRVLAAIEELGYQPNSAARQLRTGQVKTIGLVVPSVANPFWGSFAKAVEGQALEFDQQILLCNSERDPARERAYVDELWAGGVRAVIIGSSLPSFDHLRSAMERGMRLVAFDREPQLGDPPGLVTVSVDNRLGGIMATRHLLSLGHQNVGFISGAIATVSRRQRLAGYSEALRDAGVPLRTELVWAEGPSDDFGDVNSADRGQQGMKALLRIKNPPSAVVAINDMYAIGACAAAHKEGLRVPQDVSVVGFDDIMIAAFYNPPLTTIRQPLEEMSRYAVEAIQRLQADPAAGQTTAVLMGPSLVIRKSAAAPQSAPLSAHRGLREDPLGYLHRLQAISES
jgi:DNA-binding LacI/PurR family transcriptional regulator